MKVRIGTIIETGKPFLVDDGELLDTRLLVVANSGGGKSYVFRVCNEVMHARIQCGVIDWKGEYLTLREKFKYVLCGGDKCDVKLDYHAARVRPRMPDDEREREEKLEAESRERTIEMARLLLKLRDSFVIDLSSLSHKLDRLAFAGAFLNAIGDDAPKTMRRPLFVWVDEVHLLAPEKGDTAAKQPTIDIMALTRQRGAGGNAATQRLSKYDKDGEAEGNNVMVGRTMLDSDLRRSCGLLGFGTDRWADIKALHPGQFFAFGPAFNVKEPTLVQIDRAITTHPRRGHVRARRFRKPTPQLLRALKGLAAVSREKVAEEAAEADRFETMKQQIAALKKELQMSRGKIVARTEIREVEVKVKVPILTKAHEKLLQRVDTSVAKLHKVVSELQTEAESVGVKVNEVSGIIARIATVTSSAKASGASIERAKEIRQPALPPSKKSKVPTIAGSIAEPAPVELKERIIARLQYFHPSTLSREQLAFVCDISRTTKTFITAMAELSAAGTLVQASGRSGLAVGPKVTSSWGLLDTPEERVDALIALARKAERLEIEALRVLLTCDGYAERREALAGKLSISRTTKTFISAMSALSAARFIRTGGGRVTLASFILNGGN